MTYCFCPRCNKDLDDALRVSYLSGDQDYTTYFDWECPNCHETLLIEVTAIPEFSVTKKEES